MKTPGICQMEQRRTSWVFSKTLFFLWSPVWCELDSVIGLHYIRMFFKYFNKMSDHCGVATGAIWQILSVYINTINAFQIKATYGFISYFNYRKDTRYVLHLLYFFTCSCCYNYWQQCDYLLDFITNVGNNLMRRQ